MACPWRPLPLMRSGLRAVILLTWAGLMLSLWQRPGPSPFQGSGLPSELPPEASEAWQGIYRNDRKIGYAVRRRHVTEDGFRVEHRALLRLEMMGASRVVQTRVSAHTDRRLRLRDFRFEVTSGPVSFEAEGESRDGSLEVRFLPGDRTFTVPLEGPVVLPQTLPERLEAESLRTGRRFEYAMFDPMAARPERLELVVGSLVRVEISGEDREVYEVTQRYRGSEFLLWVSPEGEVLRERGPLGLTLVREERAEALAGGFGGGEALDLVSAAAIPAGREIPDPRALDTLTVRISGIPEGHTVSWPPRQVLEGDRLAIRREEPARLASYELPYGGEGFSEELGSTPFVQSDDVRIRRQAREVLDGETDAVTAARKLGRWVHDHLAKVPMVSVPTAVGVLESKQGDCNEHAVLYASLARAAGLPSRIVAGTVYMPEEGGGAGAFFYHAWVEVWLGEWIAVDPTFGQLPADATHVKFLEGGPESHGRLLALIGRLEMTVEDYL